MTSGLERLYTPGSWAGGFEVHMSYWKFSTLSLAVLFILGCARSEPPPQKTIFDPMLQSNSARDVQNTVMDQADEARKAADKESAARPVPRLRLAPGWHWLVRKLIGRWVRVTIKPDDAAALLAARPARVLRPGAREPDGPGGARHGLRQARAADSGKGLFGWARALRATWRSSWPPPPIPRATWISCRSIFWGRAPRKEVSLWRLLFAEDWVLVGASANFGRAGQRPQHLMHFGEPLRLRDAMQEGMSEEQRALGAAAPAHRLARAACPRPSARIFAPPHPGDAAAEDGADVRAAVRREMQVRGMARRAALTAARKHALEIAANIPRPSSASCRRCWDGCGTGCLTAWISGMSRP